MPNLIDVLRAAIEDQQVLELLYKGSTRHVEPHLLGYNQTDSLTLSAWQLRGSSGNGWRAFHVDRIEQVTLIGERFDSVRADFNPNDVTMRAIICSVV